MVGTKLEVVDSEPKATELFATAFAPEPIAVVLAPVAVVAFATSEELESVLPPIETEFLPKA